MSKEPVEAGKRGKSFLLLLLFAAIVIAAVRAMFRDHLFLAYSWRSPGFQDVRWFAALWFSFSACMLLWARSYTLPLISCVSLFYLCSAFGIGPFVTVLWFGVASYTLGNALAFYGGHCLRDTVEDRIIAILLGIAVYMFLISCAVHFPINTAPVYLLLLAVPLWLERKRSLRDFACIKGLFRRNAVSWPVCLALSVTGFLAICQIAMSAHPDIGWDSLEMHLTAPAFVRDHGFWNFDVTTHAWAVMPMGADWVYTIGYVLSGEPATHLLNLFALLLCAVLIFALAKRSSSNETALLLVAVFLSAPLTQIETNTLFVENLLSAFVLGAFAALVRLRSERNQGYILWFFVLCGMAFEIKLGASAFFLPLLAALVVASLGPVRQQPNYFRIMTFSVAVFLVLAAAPYFTAYLKTGNPIFPFYNQVFHSPYWPPQNFVDFRWKTPLSLRTLGDMTFHSQKYLEYYDGGFGVLYYLLIPLSACALLLGTGNRLSVSSFLIGSGAFVLICLQLAYLRYVYPALPFLLIGAASALEFLRTNLRRLYAIPLVIILAGIAVNVFLSPPTTANTLALNPFDPNSAARFELLQRPQRLAIDYLNLCFPGEPAAFLTAPPDVAGLIGRAYQNLWYDREFLEEVARASDRNAMLQLAARHRLKLFVYTTSNLAELSTPVRQFLAKDTKELATFNGVVVCKLAR